MAIAPLEELDDWQLEDDEQDIKGWPVLDASGVELGRVSGLIVDTDKERVVEIVADNGARFDPRDVDIRDDVVVLRGRAADAATSLDATRPSLENDVDASLERADSGDDAPDETLSSPMTSPGIPGSQLSGVVPSDNERSTFDARPRVRVRRSS